jgi:hypothetical protein
MGVFMAHCRDMTYVDAGESATHMRLAVLLSNRSALSKTFSELLACDEEETRGVFGTVAIAAAPNAALNGVAGTGVP